MKNIISIIAFGLLLLSSCSYTQKIKDGTTAVERKQFAVAIPFLKKEYEKEKSKVEKGKLAFLLGECYRQMNRPTDAIPWYEIAYNFQYGLDALKEFAFAHKQSGNYKEAMEAFKNLGIELGSPYEYRKEIKACEIAQTWEKEASKSPFVVQSAPFNSSSADYSPALFGKDRVAFTSDRASATGDEKYNWTGMGFSDIFIANAEGTDISPIADIPINSDQHEGTFSSNGTQTAIYFTRCFSNSSQDAYCKILATYQEGEQWSLPRPLPFCKDGINYGHPSVTADGNTLYFSANAPDGWGGYDIYVTEKNQEDWSEPILLSRSINSPQDEKFPVIEGDTLYFASSGHTGMGGLDIFRSYKLQNNSWSPAYNLKAPVNSASDDFGYVVDKRVRPGDDIAYIAYFSSSRPDGYGMDDIYKVSRKAYFEDTTVVTMDIDYEIKLQIFVLEKIYAIPNDPNSRVLGRKPIPNSTVTVVLRDSLSNFITDNNGNFTLKLEENADYSFLAEAPQFLSKSARFSTRGIGKDPSNPSLEFEMEIELDKIFLNKEIELENIYYDFDEAYIRDDAQPTLNALAQTLLENPDIRIELGSHTDCRGNNKYNQDLSQRRAQAAVDYLISKGVGDDRLQAIGYGESNPANDCNCASCTEEEHQENRRTTFKIIE